VYHFHANGTDLVFLSSADWMDRNLIRRIEAATPVRQAADKQRILYEAFETHLMASENAWLLQSDGTWKRAIPEAAGPYDSQQVLLDALSEAGGARTSD
jgi:polyphosphate kinase